MFTSVHCYKSVALLSVVIFIDFCQSVRIFLKGKHSIVPKIFTYLQVTFRPIFGWEVIAVVPFLLYRRSCTQLMPNGSATAYSTIDLLLSLLQTSSKMSTCRPLRPRPTTLEALLPSPVLEGAPRTYSGGPAPARSDSRCPRRRRERRRRRCRISPASGRPSTTLNGTTAYYLSTAYTRPMPINSPRSVYYYYYENRTESTK